MSTPTADFTVSPRRYNDDDAWFGLIANPTGSVNVPITDSYHVLPDPAAPWHDTEPQLTDTQDHSTGKAVTMSGETTITVIGNLTSDPELRFTPVSREFMKSERSSSENPSAECVVATADRRAREFTLSPRLYANEDGRFGKDANPSGRVVLPATPATPEW